MNDKLRLPKQWEHWCQVNNLRPHGNLRRKRWTYLKGQGRVWRIAYDNVGDRGHWFQGGDRHEQFDRWALSKRYDFTIPKTLTEFSAAIDSLKPKP
jgi:hypothetical protein